MPVIYAYESDGLYVASMEGQKVRMMRKSSHVCFEVDEYDGAGGWRSVIVQGDYEELDEAGAQVALALLAERFGRADEEGRARRRHGAGGHSIVCFRIRIREVTDRATQR